MRRWSSALTLGLTVCLTTRTAAAQRLQVDPCGTARLRAVNVALAAACLLALHAILRLQDAPQPAQPQRQQQQQPSSSNSSLLARSWAWLDQPAPALLWAVALAHLPLHWFYTYLYYTDVGSTLFLLLCLLAAAPISTSGGGGTSKGRFAAAALSALSGGMAVLFRQTNAVWVAFVIGAVLVRRTMGDPPAPVATDGSAAGGSGAVPAASSGSSGAAAGPGPAAQEPAAVTTDAQRSRGAGVPVPAVLQELRALLAVLWRERGPLLAELWPLLLVPAGFVVFLVRNGGVTVGDKEAHQPVRHAAQLVYFVLYCLAWLWPVVFWAAPAARSAGARAPGVAVSALLLASGLAAAAVRTAPPPHPYLLADNRHYTFYVWRRLLARAPQALARRGAGAAAAAAAAGVAQQQEGDKIVTLLLPYAAGATTVTLAYLLLRRQRQLWAVGYAACLAMVLVPAWLLEFRCGGRGGRGPHTRDQDRWPAVL